MNCFCHYGDCSTSFRLIYNFISTSAQRHFDLFITSFERVHNVISTSAQRHFDLFTTTFRRFTTSFWFVHNVISTSARHFDFVNKSKWREHVISTWLQRHFDDSQRYFDLFTTSFRWFTTLFHLVHKVISMFNTLHLNTACLGSITLFLQLKSRSCLFYHPWFNQSHALSKNQVQPFNYINTRQTELRYISICKSNLTVFL